MEKTENKKVVILSVALAVCILAVIVMGVMLISAGGEKADAPQWLMAPVSEDEAAKSAGYDPKFMQMAIENAKSNKNGGPIGAVIVKDGKILGEGYHKKAGTNHAETAAIADAKKKGNDIRGASIYVTLEPCSKPGRVGACTDAIVAAGISHVYYAVSDPNPTNRGRAKRVLARHGITCDCLATRAFTAFRPEETYEQRCDRACLKDLVDAAKKLIAPFRKHVTTGLPYVTVKLAMSLDGRICDTTGNAKWISSAESRKLTGGLRTQVDAIMVGAETVRTDNPSLLSHGKRNDDLIRVIVSRSGKLPKTAQVVTDGAPNETLVYRDAKAALVDLGKRGCLHVLCEGGLALARSLADEGLVDAWKLVTAPIVIGNRPIAEALRFKLESNGILDPYAGDRIGDYVNPKRR